MKIKKIYQGSIPANKILNSRSTSQTDTYSCEKINEMTEEVYSTEERKIGTWINGKPLYRKTVYIEELPNENTGIYEHGIPNIDEKWIGNGSFVIETNGNSSPIPNTWGTSEVSGIYISPQSIYIKTTANYSPRSAYITIEYTKTTD